jgi:molybdopterin/thiamine biosynthesis adenylyltransferase
MSDPDTRYSRSEALFGKDGQLKIANARVAIIGLGGLGSHIAQQLAYLGVRNVVLIDPDIVTQSSLNRLVGAFPSDAEARTPKVTAVARMYASVLPEASIETFQTALDDEDSGRAIRRCSSAFSCLDDDAARLALAELCLRNKIPFFDLASDTGGVAPDRWYGGRILFSGNGERCPMCLDLLDQQALARSKMSEEELQVDHRIYGVHADHLEGTGPAVVSLNAVVASLAVTEWMVWTTGLRHPRPLLEYRGQMGGVFISGDTPREGCYYCSLWGTAWPSG